MERAYAFELGYGSRRGGDGHMRWMLGPRDLCGFGRTLSARPLDCNEITPILFAFDDAPVHPESFPQWTNSAPHDLPVPFALFFQRMGF